MYNFFTEVVACRGTKKNAESCTCSTKSCNADAAYFTSIDDGVREVKGFMHVTHKIDFFLSLHFFNSMLKIPFLIPNKIIFCAYIFPLCWKILTIFSPLSIDFPLTLSIYALSIHINHTFNQEIVDKFIQKMAFYSISKKLYKKKESTKKENFFHFTLARTIYSKPTLLFLN